jgi:hypothetical protein
VRRLLSSFIPPLTSIWILQGTDVNILIFIDCEIKTSEVGVTLKHLNVKSEDLFCKNLYKICSLYYKFFFVKCKITKCIFTYQLIIIISKVNLKAGQVKFRILIDHNAYTKSKLFIYS